jgi:hypothetical protein
VKVQLIGMAESRSGLVEVRVTEVEHGPTKGERRVVLAGVGRYPSFEFTGENATEFAELIAQAAAVA